MTRPTGLRNAALVAALAAVVAAGSASAQKKGGRHEQMDYGPFLTASIGEMVANKVKDRKTGKESVRYDNAWHPKGNNANKGIAVRLGADDAAAVCFDTDLCRVSAGWTGGFLHLRGTPFDGSHGSWPGIKGEVVFRTPVGPGWAKPGTDDFKDPRSEPYGPLPRGWAKYRGLYLHGDKVIFKYTVGDAEVLEMPGLQGAGETAVITRTFNVGPVKTPLTLMVAEGAVTAVVAATAGKPELASADGRTVLKLPASDAPAAFTVYLSKAEKIAAEGPGSDLAALTKGGPARWTQTVETKGVLGESKGDAAFLVDTLTLPDDNPYKSWMRLGGMDFFSDGKRAAVSTWSGDVWIVSGIDDKLEKLTWKRYATGLYQALGLRIVGDVVYVTGRDQITRLHDLNGDGEADFYECFNNDATTSTAFHEFVFDLQTDPEGNFYYSHGGGVNPGGRGFQPNPPPSHHGCVLKVSKDGSKTEVFATGFRAPNGIGVGPDGTVTAGDNEGTWMPACRLSWVTPGSFNGCVSMAHRPTAPTTYDPPICWLPHGQVDNSCGGQTWVTVDNWPLPKGTLLHTSYGKSSLYHAVIDKGDGYFQGGVVRVPVNFLTGVCRPRFNAADGHLYVAGLKGWQTNGARDGAFQRVRPTGKPYDTVVGMKVTASGIDLTFSRPLETASAGDAANYGMEQWNYNWSQNYGSPELSVADPKKKGRDRVEIRNVKLSADGRTVSLEIPGIKPVMQFRINYNVKSADGATVKQDLFGTINKVP
jgi:hypothetical protein